MLLYFVGVVECVVLCIVKKVETFQRSTEGILIMPSKTAHEVEWDDLGVFFYHI